LDQLKKHPRRERAKRFIAIFIDRFTHAGINDGAIVIAFWELLSIFPLLIFLGNLLPLLHLNSTTVLSYVEGVIPETIYKHMLPTVDHFLRRGNGGLLSFGALGTLWTASRGINALKRMMDRTYGVLEKQNFILLRLIALPMTIFLVICMMAIVLTFSFGQQVLDYITPIFHLPEHFIDTFQALKWPVSTSVMFLMLLVIYYVLPNIKLKMRSVIPGAVITTAGWLGLAQLFSLYVSYLTRSLLSYGTIGFFMVLMFWLDFSAWILMFGAVVNVVVEQTFFGKVRENRNHLQDFLKRRHQRKQRLP
jgi:membrane protein